VLKLGNLHRRRPRVVLGNLDQGLSQRDNEGVRFAIGLVVVVTKDLLEPLRFDKIAPGWQSSRGA
jgi:hypothetical protein